MNEEIKIEEYTEEREIRDRTMIMRMTATEKAHLTEAAIIEVRKTGNFTTCADIIRTALHEYYKKRGLFNE